MRLLSVRAFVYWESLPKTGLDVLHPGGDGLFQIGGSLLPVRGHKPQSPGQKYHFFGTGGRENKILGMAAHNTHGID